MSPEPHPAAPEFRRDPVSGRWVVVAPERAQRPVTLEEAPPPRADDRVGCPFCPGNEHDTPHEVLADRDVGTPPDGPGWRLRVVPNKYPAVRPDAPAAGRHEVVVETPDHIADPADLSDAQFRAVFQAYRDRLITLAEDTTLAAAAVFKNVGAEAGASLGHTHSQIVATPLVPPDLQLELDRSAAYHAEHGRCVFCDLIAAERAAGVRVVAETANVLAVAAYAPRFAYETWVLPKPHAGRFETTDDGWLAEFADVVKRVVRGLGRVPGAAAYNWFLHAAPLRSAELPHYHWHVEVLPRTARPAGLEWGFGCFVTAVAPERAAVELRGL